jgi:sigma-B regulation protein RsbU (phosphoserine phosphatase)
MALSKTLLRSEAMLRYATPEILARVNNALCVENRECMFLTVFCLILNTRTGETECCSAGHHPALLRSSDGSVRRIHAKPGLLVGFEPGYLCEPTTERLKPGDIVFLYTDGVTEAENPNAEHFSEEQLLKSISALSSSDLQEIVSAIRQEIARHAQGQPQSDDITFLALKYNGPVRPA